MLIMLGLAFTYRQKTTEATRLFQEALAVWWAIDDTSKSGWALSEIGRTLRELGRYDEAASYGIADADVITRPMLTTEAATG